MGSSGAPQPVDARWHRRDTCPVSLLIRRAEPDELDRVGELTVRAYQSDGLVPLDSGYDTQLRDARSRHAGAELLVAAEAESILGTVTFAVPGSPYAEVCHAGEAELRMLAVDPAARRRGVARALVQACLDRAREQGASALVLSSAVDMYPAHRLYTSLGFHRLPERDWSPVPGVDLLAFELPLAAELPTR